MDGQEKLNSMIMGFLLAVIILLFGLTYLKSEQIETLASIGLQLEVEFYDLGKSMSTYLYEEGEAKELNLKIKEVLLGLDSIKNEEASNLKGYKDDLKEYWTSYDDMVASISKLNEVVKVATDKEEVITSYIDFIKEYEKYIKEGMEIVERLYWQEEYKMTNTLLKFKVSQEVSDLRNRVSRMGFKDDSEKSRLIKAIDIFKVRVLDSAEDIKLKDITSSEYRMFSYEVSLQIAILIHSTFNKIRLNSFFFELMTNLSLLPRTDSSENEIVDLLRETAELAYKRMAKESETTKSNIREVNKFLITMYDAVVLNKSIATLTASKKVQVTEEMFNSIGVTIDTEIRDNSVKYLSLNANRKVESHA